MHQPPLFPVFNVYELETVISDMDLANIHILFPDTASQTHSVLFPVCSCVIYDPIFHAAAVQRQTSHPVT